MLINYRRIINILFIYRILGIIIISLYTLFCTDIKIILAYSSIIHINGIVLIILRNNIETENIFTLIIIRHSFSSSMIFFIVGIIYEYTYRRNIIINKSTFLNFEIFFIIIFFVLFANIGTPPFINFFSEIYIYISLINFNNNILLIVTIILLLTILFNLILLKNLSIGTIIKFFKIYNLKIIAIFISLEHLIYIITFI